MKKQTKTIATVAVEIPAAQQEQAVPLALSQLALSPLNPRRKVVANLDELTASIRQDGITNPLIAMPALQPNGHVYDVLAGGRRFRAATALGMKEVPVIIRNYTVEQAKRFAQIDNIQRSDIHPMEEALQYREMLPDYDHNVAALAARVGKTEEHVYRRLVLCSLIQEAQDIFLEGFMGIKGAYRIARLQESDQKRVLEKFYANCRDEEFEAPYVDDIDDFIEGEVLVALSSAPFKIADAELVPAAGACTTCPKHTGANRMLWEEIEGTDRCSDPACFQSKVKAMLDQKREALGKSKRGFVELSDIHNSTREGVLKGSDYVSVEKGNDCPSTKNGLVVEGYGRVGSTFLVCADKECKEHHKKPRQAAIAATGGTGVSEERKRQMAAQIDTNIRSRTLQGIIARFKAPVRADLNLMARAFVDKLNYDEQRSLWRVMGWDIPKGTQGYPPQAPFDAALKSWSDAQVMAFLVAVALAPEAKMYTHGKLGQYEGPLFDAADRLKVPVDQIKSYCTDEAAARKLKGTARKESLAALDAPDPLVKEAKPEDTETPKPAKKTAKKGKNGSKAKGSSKAKSKSKK